MIFNENMLSMLRNSAKDAFDKFEIPVSALIFDKDFNVICCKCNNRQGTCSVIGHAEILSILEAEKLIGDWRLDGYSMLVNLEPCEMCYSVIRECRLDHVYFFVSKPENSKKKDANFICLDGYDEEKLYYKNLLTSFFDNMR